MKLRTEGGHFWITFKNGLTLSCFNGYGSHTENWDKFDKWSSIFMAKKPNPHNNYWESSLVEIAILKDNELITQDILDSDDCVKTVDITELINVINIVNKVGDLDEKN